MLGARSTVRSLLSRVLSKTVKSFAACKPAAPLAALQKRSFAAESTKSVLDFHDGFVNRHIGPNDDADVKKMLKVIGYNSLDALIDATVPASIRIARPLQLDGPKGEAETLAEFKEMMSANKVFKSYLGAGYFNTITPPVILRNIIENPAWYTPYTPYQAEIAQGRLEMLLNYQTMVCDLTGFPVANASLLDEATAAAEAMTMCFNSGKDAQNVLLVSSDVNPATLAVLRTRAEGFNIHVRVQDHTAFDLSNNDVFAVIVQYPAHSGSVEDLRLIADRVHAAGAKVIAATDLLALTLLTPPGEWGADVAVGNSQRFGVPLGFGGPHAAFFATSEAYKRKLPGRVIGVSKDSRGLPALRMAMQTREQHIRREKATSNICTAQALLSNTAASYAIYHGPEGLRHIATKVHTAALTFAAGVESLGLKVAHKTFFDTVQVELPAAGGVDADAVLAAGHARGLNFRKCSERAVLLSFDETVTAADLQAVVDTFAQAMGRKQGEFDVRAAAARAAVSLPPAIARKSAYLTHPVFNSYHAEHEMLRYLYLLQSKDLSLCTAMIPLGSCTMKLNATSEMIPITLPTVNAIHPLAPASQTQGYARLLATLHDWLAEVTGFHAVSFQPNSGAQGEYAGLLAIQGYHKARGDAHRNICLIPTSAHGTNPASAAMAGMRIVTVAVKDDGEVDQEDLRAKATKYRKDLSCLMVTYPSTHGVFENTIREICSMVHENGGMVYMDGANMNAQVGLCRPGDIGADVCHLNLHKTFCIPHGGGGPGMGPIGVVKALAPHLPGHPSNNSETATSAGAVSAAPFSSASILPISWMYIRMMGGTGLTRATKAAILNANYMAKRLAGHYSVLFTGDQGTVAHEFILDIRPIKAACGVTEEDIAKRLQDYNFHAPTMSWPVVGTLMIEPTESESLYEVDRFCDAMISIRQEIREVETGAADKTNNVLKNAPHTCDTVLSDTWTRPYPRERAAYPLKYLRSKKFWPTVGRLDNVFGDRNVVCTCPPIESYESK